MLLNDPTVLDKLHSWIATPNAFWLQKHRKIWIAALEMNKEGKSIDSISMLEKCKQKYGDEIEAKYLAELKMDASNSDSAENHASIVWSNHLRREMIKVSQELEDASRKNDSKTADLLIRHQRYMEEIFNLQPSKSKSIDNIVFDVLNTLKTGSNIIEFGLPFLDFSAGGMTRGELTAIGGRPGHGKTTLMLNIVKSLISQGLKVMLFNREMTNIETIKKLIIMESGNLSYSLLRAKKITDEHMYEITKIANKIVAKYKYLRMYDDIRDLDSSIREVKRYQPDVFIDDYIQLIKVNNSKKRDRRFEIEDIMNDYKWIAKKTKSSGILISQLNREVEKRMNQTPTMGDYAEGGTIEQLAENCYFVYYGYAFDPQEYSELQNEIIVKKARYGKIASIPVKFNGDKCTFG